MTTPAEVHTSVSRWRIAWAIERWVRADCSITQASPPLKAELTTESRAEPHLFQRLRRAQAQRRPT